MNNRYGTFAIAASIVVAANFTAAPGVRSAHAESTVPSYSEDVKALEKQMATGKDAKKVSEQDRAVMARAAADLAAQMPHPGIKVGEKAPDFSLKSPAGKTVNLYALLKKGPVVLTFYRGAWCPYCNLQLRELKAAIPQFRQHGATLVAITPQTPDKSLGQFKQDGFPFDVLSDLDYNVTKSYKLLWVVSPELDAVYKHAFGLDVEAFNGRGRLGLPIPGTFVIDQGGIVRAAFADTDYKKRMEPADILAALEKLSRTSGDDIKKR